MQKENIEKKHKMASNKKTPILQVPEKLTSSVLEVNFSGT